MTKTLPNQTAADFLAAMDYLRAAITEHGLPVDSVDIIPRSPSAYRHDAAEDNWTKEFHAEIRLRLFDDPAAFLAWTRHLNPDRVSVKRRDVDTCIHFWVGRHGFKWVASGALPIPATGPRLPGITVEWERTPSGRRGDDAWISVEDLHTTVALIEAAA